MKRIVWTFGLLAGAVLSVMMLATIPFMEQTGSGIAMVVGYATMVAAFLMVWFGVRRYRDEVLGGVIGFGRAFKVGMLITLVASSCYVATWEVLQHTMMPDFAAKYGARQLAEARAAGATPAQLEAKSREMRRFQEMYSNPFYNVGMTFLEPLPVGIVFALACAGVLSRRRKPSPSDPLTTPVVI